MTQTTVSGGTPPPAAAAQPAQQQPAVDATALQKQIDDLKSVLSEKDQAIQSLNERVNARPPAAAAAKEEEEDEEVDVLDVFTKGGKALDHLLEKRGFVKASTVDQRMTEKVTAVQREQALIEEYPELADKSSEFFKTTASHYGSLRKQGIGEALAMEMATERTALAMMREGKILTPAQKKEQDKQQRAEERRARANAQAGDRGTRTAEGSDEDDDLTPEQKHIARAMGITEDAYKARAKGGVAMRGVR